MNNHYDVLIVGGGLVGSALGKSLAEQGISVLIVEREQVFRDRVRGEYLHPWGVEDARALGIYDLLLQSCGREGRYRLNQIFQAPPASPRDMVATTPHHNGSLHFYHPEMQEVLLQAARQAGCTVQRGAVVSQVKGGAQPGITIGNGGDAQTFQGRLVVGADGRNSNVRKWASFRVQHDQERMIIAGLLLKDVVAPDDTVMTYINPANSSGALVIPIGNQRFRCYMTLYQQEGYQRLSGQKDIGKFIDAMISSGTPRAWFDRAVAGGPLASFDCADTYVPHPYQNGVVLVGDAAAASDPSFGCGLSLALHDVRVLRDHLIRQQDWDQAGHQYAAEHDQTFGTIHTLTDWMTRLFYEPGSAANERRRRAFARVAEDPRRMPDIAGLGPDSPSDKAAYYNLFGEDIE